MPRPPIADQARELLKAATALKREKHYEEAILMLHRAYSAQTPFPMMIEERLRLPMYLLLAGRDDEGWREIDALELNYPDGFSQARIAAQRAVFLRKRGDSAEALVYCAYAICWQHLCDVGTTDAMVRRADEEAGRAVEWKKLGLPPWPQSLPVSGITPSGNPIYAMGYQVVRDRLHSGYSGEALHAQFGRDLKEVVGDKAEGFLHDFAEYLPSEVPYELATVRRLLEQYVPAKVDHCTNTAIVATTKLV